MDRHGLAREAAVKYDRNPRFVPRHARRPRRWRRSHRSCIEAGHPGARFGKWPGPKPRATLIRDREAYGATVTQFEAEYSEFEHLLGCQLRLELRIEVLPHGRSQLTDVASAFGHGP